jgi:hypothetical protein
LYPVHVSASFLQSPTTGSALYLMLLFFMHRDYNLVSQLINSVATEKLRNNPNSREFMGNNKT